MHTGPRVPAGTRHSLRPLISWGEAIRCNLEQIMLRECEPVSPRHCERSEAIHGPPVCGAMDCFAALAMTAERETALVKTACSETSIPSTHSATAVRPLLLFRSVCRRRCRAWQAAHVTRTEQRRVATRYV